MSQIITIKRGASLGLNVAFTNADGTPFVLTGVMLNAMLRDAEENLVATITPVATGTPGQASIFVQDTSAWPQGLLRLDVFAQAQGGPQVISDTIGIEVENAITQTVPAAAPFNPVANVPGPDFVDGGGIDE